VPCSQEEGSQLFEERARGNHDSDESFRLYAAGFLSTCCPLRVLNFQEEESSCRSHAQGQEGTYALIQRVCAKQAQVLDQGPNSGSVQGRCPLYWRDCQNRGKSRGLQERHAHTPLVLPPRGQSSFFVTIIVQRLNADSLNLSLSFFFSFFFQWE